MIIPSQNQLYKTNKQLFVLGYLFGLKYFSSFHKQKLVYQTNGRNHHVWRCGPETTLVQRAGWSQKKYPVGSFQKIGWKQRGMMRKRKT